MTHDKPSHPTHWTTTSGQRFARIVFYTSIVGLVYFATSKQEPIIQMSNFDKLQHIGAFGWLAFIAYFGWRHSFFKRFFIIFTISCFIEFAQEFLAFRTASWLDLAANATGIILSQCLLTVFTTKRAANAPE